MESLAGKKFRLNEAWSIGRARVIGNTIQNNAGAGVQIVRDSHADIAGNTIHNNSDGIEVGENSLVQLGEDSGSRIYESANSGPTRGSASSA